ncbi:MAG: hypothetical protein RL398_617 [Planctomycetota bacterium]
MLALAFLLLTSLPQGPVVSQPAAPAVRNDPWPSVVDVDGDGTAEIRSLRQLARRGEPQAPTVAVLVEARLLQTRAGGDLHAVTALRSGLDRLLADMAASGRCAELLEVECYSGERHQDGRIVLGLRRALQRRAASGPLEGAILVGHFPDALLLRTCNWRRDDAVELTPPNGEKRGFAPYLRAVPENVAWKCDLVLADLDGDWESRYFEAETALPSTLAAFAGAVPASGGKALAWREDSIVYRDAFHVADGRVHVDAATGAVVIDDASRDAECTARDREASNPVAQPEIAVSRIDARGAAWSPRARFLDSEGRPRTVAFGDGEPMPAWHEVFAPDPALEMRLLIEYFNRNHAFRTQAPLAEADRPASAAWELGSGMAACREAKPGWRDFAEAGYDLHRRADLSALTAWWRLPATLRTLRAHSDPFAAVFARTDAERLDRHFEVAWAFTPRERELVPSLAAACAGGRADFFYYRTLWANDATASQPYLMVHTGCEAIAPHGATTLRYDDPRYGMRQHAESILFYTPCVALIGRAKVFYDEPREFSATLAAGGTIGAAWRRYFAVEAASTWEVAGGDIGRKRAYFWSLLGDFTLRLP